LLVAIILLFKKLTLEDKIGLFFEFQALHINSLASKTFSPLENRSK